MTIKHAVTWLGALLLAIALMLPQGLRAQQADTPPLSKEELQQILAPIALFPDELLTNVLMAATYPLEIVQAARWQKEPANANLKGDALTKALEAESWDPSVKSLVPFPDVLQYMSEKLDWTQKVGDAFLAQQAEVMDQIQFLRARAEDAGNLKSNKYQKVEKQGQAIVIQPAGPEVVYVPVYEPSVYGPWWAPAYPPYFLPPPVGAVLVGGVFWGAGYAISNSLWGWNRWDWGRHNVYINTNRYNNINVGRPPISSNAWQHNPTHRGSVPYKDKGSRDRYGSGRPSGDARGPGAGKTTGPGGDKSKTGAKPQTKTGAKPQTKTGSKPQTKSTGKSQPKSTSKSSGAPKSGATSKSRSAPKAAPGSGGRPPSGARGGARPGPKASGGARGGARGGERGRR